MDKTRLLKSPVITRVDWGIMDVDHDGKVSQFKDCKLWPGHAEKWDWSTTGTRHKPGIQPADVEAMLDSIDVLILSEGMQRALGVCASTLELLKQRKIMTHQLPTKEAVDKYNALITQGLHRVGGIFHSTC